MATVILNRLPSHRVIQGRHLLKAIIMTLTLSMIKSVVVYHSGYGHTERIAASVAESASATLVAIDSEGAVTRQPFKNSDELMKIIDTINNSGLVRVWFAGKSGDSGYKMKREMLSAAYTTNFSQ